jgi:signal transduction histidine kinase
MSANQKLRQEIAERERAEQALRESERRRVEAEKLAATGRLAARVAHEINNPLAGILNCLQLVKAAVPEDHRHHEYAELIEKEIDRIGRIVRQMLLVHRPDQETVQDVHVVETIDQVVAILAPNCRDRRLRVETRADPSEITIRIPEGSLRQILYNLLANAVEASPPGGTIKIGASMLDGGNAVEITVADPGEGIPEDVQDRIFEPFFTTKEGGPSGNVGLGLSISKGIIDSLGGALDFETTPGEGTTFRVVLPSTDR